jgi:hypothetical protein
MKYMVYNPMTGKELYSTNSKAQALNMGARWHTQLTTTIIAVVDMATGEALAVYGRGV